MFGLRLSVVRSSPMAPRGRRPSCRPRCSSGPGSAISSACSSERYGRRAQALKARSALAALRVIGEELDRRGIAGASDVVVAVDRLEASSQDLALLRLLHLVLTGAVELTPTSATRSTACAPRRRPRTPASGRRPTRRPTRPRTRARRGRALALACGQPVQRPPDGRGGRDRQPRLRGHLRRVPADAASTPAGLAHCTRTRGGRMDTGTFYATTSAVSFTLLGFWWVVVQFRHDEMTQRPRPPSARVRRVPPLHPARPDVARGAADGGCAPDLAADLRHGRDRRA